MRAWSQRRRMKDPVAGEFVVVDQYFPHPGRTPMQVMLTGFIDVDGVPRTPVQTLRDRNSDPGVRRLPVTVDRGDPTSFIVDWKRVPRFDGGAAAAREAAAKAAGTD